MALDFDVMNAGIEDAKLTLQRADRVTGTMASIIRGRLRQGNIPSYVLADLKRELNNYNMHTGKWKND